MKKIEYELLDPENWKPKIKEISKKISKHYQSVRDWYSQHKKEFEVQIIQKVKED